MEIPGIILHLHGCDDVQVRSLIAWQIMIVDQACIIIQHSRRLNGDFIGCLGQFIVSARCFQAEIRLVRRIKALQGIDVPGKHLEGRIALPVRLRIRDAMARFSVHWF